MLKLLIIPYERNNFSPYLLRKVAILFYTAILLTVNVLPGIIPGFLPQAVSKVSASSIDSEKLIQLTNEERRKYGLNELNTNIYLTTAAYAKANDMLQYQYWDHFGPNSEKNSPWYFIKSTGYNYIYAGENLAKGFKTSEGIHQAWLASPTHRENILSRNYKDIGIAVIYGNLQGEEVTLVVQMFGNLTADSEQISIPNEIEYPESEENGEIKSIKITYPEDGITINNPQINIEGSIEGDVTSYDLYIYENENQLVNKQQTSNSWSYESAIDWSEGEHDLVAKAVSGDQEMMTDSNFIVDSTPPKLIENSLKATLLGEEWKVQLLLNEPSGQATVISGNKSFEMVLAGSGELETRIASGDIKDTVSLLLSDEIGNINEIDISDEFSGTDNGNVLGIVTSSLNMSDVVNVSLGLFVLALLAIEIYYYKKLGRLAENVHSVMFIGLWLTIILFTIFAGFGGEVVV